MTEERYWRLSLAIPIVIPPVIVPTIFATIYAAYFLRLPLGGLGGILEFLAAVLIASVPMGLPPFVPMALWALVALRKRGSGRAIRRILWILPFAYWAAFSLFWTLFLKFFPTERRVPLGLCEGSAFVGATAYILLAYFGFRILTKRGVIPLNGRPSEAPTQLDNRPSR
jgi:hypothetical protein